MKKKLLLILFIIICLPISVLAKDKPFYKKFQTNEIKSFNVASVFTKTVELKDNYYTFSEKIDSDNERYPSLFIKKYDNKGNLIKEDFIKNTIIIEATNDDNNLYLFSANLSSQTIKLLKIDAELNVVNSYIFTDDDFNSMEYIDEYYILNFIFNNIDIMNVKNNYVNIFLEDYILQFDMELTHLQILDTDYSKVKELFPKIYKLEYFSAELYDTDDNYQVYIEDNCYKEKSSCGFTLNFLDSNESVLWSKNFGYYEKNASVYINDLKIVNDYVVLLKTLNNGENTYTKILIYNFNGDLVQEINNGEYIIYNEILPTSLGFKVIKINNESNKCYFGGSEASMIFQQEENALSLEESYCTFMQSEEFYYLYYLIDSKVAGNGRIEYPNKSKAGQQVSFKAQAEENYTVKNVVVKDINGNIIKVENGSFIMPEEDVIIEAEFVALRNPYTKGGLLGIMLIIICIIIGICLQTKKVKNN